MILSLFKTNDGYNVINKTLSNELQLNITLKRDINVTNLVLELFQDEGVNFLDYNYCKITELNRLYYIDGIENIHNKIWRLNCVCDVLETYKTTIMNSNFKFRRTIGTGDYQSVSLGESLKTTNIKYESDKSMGDGTSLILTTVGV